MILMKPNKNGVSVYSYDAGYGVYKHYAEINENSPSEVLARFFSDVLVTMKNNGGRIKLYVDFKLKEVTLQDVKNFMREIKSSVLDNMNYWYFSSGNWQAPDQKEYDLHDIIHEIWHERGEE